MTKRSCVPISRSHPTQWQCVSTKSGSSLIETASSNPVLLLASARMTGLPPFALFPLDLAASSQGSADSSSSIVLDTTFEDASSKNGGGGGSGGGGAGGSCAGLPISLSVSPLDVEAEVAAVAAEVEGVEATVVTVGGASRGKYGEAADTADAAAAECSA